MDEIPHSPHLTAIAVAYSNPDTVLIADGVLPRSPVSDILFEYTSWNDDTKLFRLPNTDVGPRGKLNRIDISGTRVQNRVKDQGLELPLSYYDTRPASNTTPAGATPNVEEMATAALTSLILLRREVRAAALVFNAASYDDSCKEQFSAGATQWNHADYEGTPAANAVKTISAGLAVPLMRPNVLVFGSLAWETFRCLPEVVKACNGNSGDSGIASRQRVAELFEVQEVLVGGSWHDTAKPGETPVLSRAWGPHVSAVYRNRAAAAVGGLTFGFTAEYGTRIAASYDDKAIGLRGGKVVRVGESVQEIVCADRAGYFWEDVVALA